MNLINANTFAVHEEELFWDTVSEAIANEGFAIIDNFISAEQSAWFRNRIDEKEADDELKRAGIGKDLQFQKNLNQRGDLIAWIEKNEVLPETQVFLNKMDQAMRQLNRRLFLGLKDFETHFTHYPKGSFYKRHSDRFHANAHRVLSFVCYLNNNWLPTDGGELLLFIPEKTETVNPIGCRIAIFQSQIEHEVLPTNKDRYSITGWMLDQIEGLTFL